MDLIRDINEILKPYNKSNKKITNNGIVYQPIDNIAGVKFPIKNTNPNQEILIELELDINIKTILVIFDKDDKIIPIKNLSIKKNYQAIFKKNINEIKYIGLIYQKEEEAGTLVIRKFNVNFPEKNDITSIFQQIYYINLTNRPERKAHIMRELKRVGVPDNIITPIKAFNFPQQPQVGCAISHMRALQDAYIKKYDKILIFEDDFTFRLNNCPLYEYFKKLENNFSNWDIIQLSTVNCKTIATNIKGISKVVKADTTSGYGLKRKNIIYLFNVFKTCLNPNINIKGNHFAIDVLWQTIQNKLNWYIFTPNIGYQNEKFESDIENYRSIIWRI